MVALIAFLFCSLLAANVWFFLLRTQRPWYDKVSTILKILAFYTFAFTVAAQTELLPKALVDEMISPDLFKFLSGNFSFLGLITGAASVALDPVKAVRSPSAFLDLVVMLGLTLPILILAIFHLLVVVPLSYVAYVIASVPISAITRTKTDLGFALGNERISIQEVISHHLPAVKNLSISFVSTVTSVAVEVVGTYHSAARLADGAQQSGREGWLIRHPRMAGRILLASEVILGIFVFASVVAAISLPWIPTSDDPTDVVTGDIIGVEIVTVFLVWAMTALLFKAERRRTGIGPAAPDQTPPAGEAASTDQSDVPARRAVSVRTMRLRKAARWALVGALPAAALWLSYSVVTTQRQQFLMEQCQNNGASSCQAACDQGILTDCVRLGWLYERGVSGLPKNISVAAGLYDKACTGGDGGGCSNLGLMYKSGLGGRGKDPRRAAMLFQRACDGGVGEGCTNLGLMHKEGSGIVKDLKRASDLYAKACALGHSLACNDLGVMYQSGNEGVTKDAARALALYQKACEAGQLLGCNNAGVMYEEGGGVAPDITHALDLYQQACAGNIALGCVNLGDVYELGAAGIPRNRPRAAEFYQQGCDLGHALACTTLGAWYERGEGLAADPARAVTLYRKGCDQGFSRSCIILGRLYEDGRGALGKNPTAAAGLYQTACDRDDSMGCSLLARLYENGASGLDKSIERAAQLYGKACDGDSAIACAALGDILVREEGAERAVALYQKACVKGEAVGCNNLGVMYEEALGGLTRDVAKAVGLYQKGCEIGSVKSCDNLRRLRPNLERK